MTDWYSEYTKALNTIATLRCSLAFIEGYSHSIVKYPQSNAEWVRHMTEINGRAAAALRTTHCDVCDADIDLSDDPDSLVQAPDYMPEDFRQRTKMLMCEPCREVQLDRQLEA